MAEEIDESQTRTQCTLYSLTCWLTGATYYRQIIVAYADRQQDLRDRVIEEWTTVSLVSALIITLAFSLFLQSPLTFDTLTSISQSPRAVSFFVVAGEQFDPEVFLDMYGICSSFSVACLLGAVLVATVLIANSSLLLEHHFPLFLNDHIHILMWPTLLLGAGLVSMSLALVAFGFIAYTLKVAIFNIVVIICGNIAFCLLYLYSLASRVMRTLGIQRRRRNAD